MVINFARGHARKKKRGKRGHAVFRTVANLCPPVAPPSSAAVTCNRVLSTPDFPSVQGETGEMNGERPTISDGGIAPETNCLAREFSSTCYGEENGGETIQEGLETITRNNRTIVFNEHDVLYNDSFSTRRELHEEN